MQNNSKKISITILATSAVLYAGAIHSFATKDSHDDFVIEKPKEEKTDPAQTKPANDELQQKLQKQKDALRAKNMFFIEPKPGVPQVSGILGDKAYYNGQPMKVGDRVGPGAEIIEITNMYVKLKYDGNELTQYPINAASLPPAPPKPKSDVKKSEPGTPNGVNPVPDEKPKTPPPMANSDKDFDKICDDLQLPPHLRDALRSRWDKASPEEKAAGIEQFNNMTQSQKDQIVSEMQRAYDAGQLN